MKLDVTCMRYLTKEDFRLLTAIEMGMRNHSIVPIELITSLAKLRFGGTYKFLSTLLRFKLIAHDGHTYNGYRLTNNGYDILALKTFLARGLITSVGPKIGVGKESDIHIAQNSEGEEVVLKFHRLGRTSFRAVKNKRDYLSNPSGSKGSWLYLSRLAAIKEYAFMEILYQNGYPTPVPLSQNRHVVLMSKVENSFPMYQIRSKGMHDPERVFKTCMELIVRLANHGLIHCDFNEFNLMIHQNTGDVTLIDFPQMISTNHINAEELFDRDVNCILKFFSMKMHYDASDDFEIPNFQQCKPQEENDSTDNDDDDNDDNDDDSNDDENYNDVQHNDDFDTTLNDNDPHNRNINEKENTDQIKNSSSLFLEDSSNTRSGNYNSTRNQKANEKKKKTTSKSKQKKSKQIRLDLDVHASGWCANDEENNLLHNSLSVFQTHSDGDAELSLSDEEYQDEYESEELDENEEENQIEKGETVIENKLTKTKEPVARNTSEVDNDIVVPSLVALELDENNKVDKENENSFLTLEDTGEDISDFEDEFNDVKDSSKTRYLNAQFALNKTEVDGIKNKVKQNFQRKKKSGGRHSSNKGRVKAASKLKNNLTAL